MKTIGLLGGMSWESTLTYYQAINRAVSERLGQLHSAKIILNSVDFHEIEQLQASGDWHRAGQILASAAKSIDAAGADCILICTNTMHKVAEQVTNATPLPLLHIAEATGRKLKQDGIKKVALLGTNFTMEQDFYKQKLIDDFDLSVIIPDRDQRSVIHSVIYEELCLGKVVSESKSAYLEIIDSLVAEGAEAVILGCTEIGLLVSGQDCDIPLYDTTMIHALAAVDFALSE